MVSIVITAYNVAAHIRQAVNSACLQSFKDIEIIVIEDCSTDNTREELEKIKDCRVNIIYNKQNIGAGASRKKGIENSKGEYLLLLDGDDWLEEDFVESLYNRAKECDADIVSGGITIVDSDGTKEQYLYGECITQGDEKITSFWGERIVFMNNKLIHRRLHLAVPYCLRRFIEDTPVIIPQLYLANKVAYINNAGYNYRMRSESLTHKASPLEYALFRALCIEDIIKFFEHNDKRILDIMPFAQTYSNCIAEIKMCKPDKETIKPYNDEWIEFTTKLIDRLV